MNAKAKPISSSVKLFCGKWVISPPELPNRKVMVNVKVLEEQLNFPKIGRSSVLEQVMPGDVRCCAYQPIAYI